MWVLQNISKKESILLGLLGVSLTTVGATLLYEFYKKDNDKAFNRKRKSICQITSIEFKVPNASVAAVIGKGGRTIREIEMKTGVTITIQKYNKYTKSDPTDRICIITGPVESIKLAQIIVQNIIDSVPVIDTYEFYVPYRAVKHILGRGRQNLQKIQEVSNAKVIIDDSDLDYKSLCHPANYSYGDPSKDGKKRIIVHGTVKQIEVALGLIEEKVQQENGVDAILQDIRPIKVPGTYTKLLTDELRNGPAFSKIILSPLPPNDAMEVYVSAMETPGQFWIQIISPGITYLESLVNQMSMYYDDVNNHPMHILKEINVGQIVAAKSIYFDQWYRAEVTKILEKSQYEVFLLDYGIFLTCSEEDLLELRTDMLSLRLQAVECKLANVKPKNGEWNEYARKEFAACTWLGQSKVMDATVKGYIQRPANFRRPARPDAVVLCVELFDKHQNIKLGPHLISLGFAEFDEDVHSEVTDLVTNIMKRQFLSVQLLTKTACLTAEEDEINEDKSVSPSNMYNSTVSQLKKSNQSAKVNVITSVEERSDVVSERKNKANISTFSTNKSDAEAESDNVIMSVKKYSYIIPEWENKAKISTLDANKNDAKPKSKSNNVTTSLEKDSDIISKHENQAEILTLDANKNDAKPKSKSDNVTTSTEEVSDIIPERENQAEISTSDADKNDAKSKSKPDNVTTSTEESSDIIPERENQAEISTLNADNNDAKPKFKPDNITTSLEEDSDIVLERKNEVNVSTLFANKNDTEPESQPEHLPINNKVESGDSN